MKTTNVQVLPAPPNQYMVGFGGDGNIWVERMEYVVAVSSYDGEGSPFAEVIPMREEEGRWLTVDFSYVGFDYVESDSEVELRKLKEFAKEEWRRWKERIEGSEAS